MESLNIFCWWLWTCSRTDWVGMDGGISWQSVWALLEADTTVHSQFCSCYAGINFIQNHPPPPPATQLEGSKNPPLGQALCTKALLLGQNRESKAPLLGSKVRKFHKYIYKLWHYLKWKALWSQQIKRFFKEETDYIIWRSPESNYWTYKSFIWYV